MKRERRLTMLIVLLVAVLAMVLAVAVTVPTLAAYFGTTEREDEFTSAHSEDPTVICDEKDGVISVHIKVPDVGYPVYVRAKIIINWKAEDDDDDVVGAFPPPSASDYELELYDSGWAYNVSDNPANGGYYYYLTPVESGETIDVLVKSFKPAEGVKPPQPGYALNIEVIAQSVQAVGYTDEVEGKEVIKAVEDAWGIDPEDLK